LRTASVERTTRETSITVTVNLDGSGAAEVETPIGFLSHMLTSLSTHSMIDISLNATGDLKHHIAEDAALCLGRAIREALGEGKPVKRFGYATVPMDCSLASCALDLGGRPYHVVSLGLRGPMVEDLAAEDLTHFLESPKCTTARTTTTGPRPRSRPSPSASGRRWRLTRGDVACPAARGSSRCLRRL